MNENALASLYGERLVFMASVAKQIALRGLRIHTLFRPTPYSMGYFLFGIAMMQFETIPRSTFNTRAMLR
jgi:hypothetical protein